MPSTANNNFSENSKDVTELWAIRQSLKGAAGVAPKQNVINRATIVFITACWESYIEDLAFEAFEYLLSNATSANQVPIKVRTLATKSILASKDSTQVWQIADGGWKNLLISHKTDIKAQWLGNFNTPKTTQVNGLFSELLGIPKLSDAWFWAAMSTKNAGNKLDGYITVRGDIAHRLNPSNPVHQHLGKAYLDHISRIVGCCEASVSSHLKKAVGTAPW